MQLDFSKFQGLIPAVIQDAADGEVLMVGFMNEEAFDKTVATGKVTFFSRTRKELWTKGGTSGHYLNAKEIRVDCDEDTLVIKAEALGPGVCHNGFRTCSTGVSRTASGSNAPNAPTIPGRCTSRAVRG